MRSYFVSKTFGSELHQEDTCAYVDVKYFHGTKDQEPCPIKHNLDIYIPKQTSSDFKEGIESFLENNANINPLENNENLAPVVIFVHGGGWKRGDKKWWFDCYGNIGRSFAKEGFVSVVPNYRLAPIHKHPAQAHDIGLAIKWVYENIHIFGGNNQKIFLCGHSAGAHIVALLGLDCSILQSYNVPHTKENSCIKGILGYCGPYDIHALNQQFSAKHAYIKHAFENDEVRKFNFYVFHY